MIKDKLENAYIYYNLSNNIKKGFEWLSSVDLNSLADGKYVIDEDRIFANVQTYETKDCAPYEGHRRYIDIQYMISGKEKVGVVNYNNCSTITTYDKEKDIEFLSNNASDCFQILEEGDFLIFYPQDAHQPALNIDRTEKVKKVIVKVEL